jgi:alkaline phosphatase D
MDRRHLLRLALATSTTLWLPRSAWSEPKFATDPFTLGVASGSPTHESVVLWTRLIAPGPSLAGPVTVRFELASDEGFTRIVKRGQVQALPELAHSVHAELGGLEADRWYFYRFFAGDAASPVGRTRTFPAPDAAVARLRLAYASCQRFEHGYFGAYRHMLHEDLDAVLFLGDYIYEYPTAARPVRLPTGGWVLTLDDYRQRYALHKAEAELQAMHAACPWLVTWDDHEVHNDYAGPGPGTGGPAVPDFAARRAAAYQAFYEHMPLPAAALTRALGGLAQGAEMRLYAQVRFGRLAQICLLDDRQYRDPHACTRDGRPGSSTVAVNDCAALADPARTLLGAAQEAWLDRALAGGDDGWHVVGQQTLFGPRNLAAAPGAPPVRWNDGWDGYPAARERLLAGLRRNGVRNAVLFGGDMHENWVGHVKADYADPDSASLGVEFCGTSITSRSGGNARTADHLARNPHFVFADAERKGYGVAEFTPQRLTTSLRVVSDVTQKAPAISTLARFSVAAGSARVERD